MSRNGVSALSCCLFLQACSSPEQGVETQNGNNSVDVDAGFVPVTDAMLRNPDPSDWLMYSRTYDAQRFSPLDSINQDNVANLERAWVKPLPAGVIEIIPIVWLPIPIRDIHANATLA